MSNIHRKGSQEGDRVMRLCVTRVERGLLGVKEDREVVRGEKKEERRGEVIHTDYA